MRIGTAVMTLSVAMLAAWVLGGCGGSSDTVEDIPGETAEYLPLAVGTVWENNFTQYVAPAGAKSVRPSRRPSRPYVGTKQVTGTDTVTVTGISVIDDKEWASVVSQYAGGDPEPAIYMRHNAEGLLRLADIETQPSFVMKNPVAVGTTWTESWIGVDDVAGTSRITIRSVSDTITTPLGEYTDCMKIEEVVTQPADANEVWTNWYAPNVGLVRGEHHVDNVLWDLVELTAFTPAPLGAVR